MATQPHAIRKTCQQAASRDKNSRFCFAHLGVGCLIQAVFRNKCLFMCRTRNNLSTGFSIESNATGSITAASGTKEVVKSVGNKKIQTDDISTLRYANDEKKIKTYIPFIAIKGKKLMILIFQRVMNFVAVAI